MESTAEETRPELPDLPLIEAETAAEICEKCELRGEALEQLEDEMTPKAFLVALMDREIFPDAIKFLAQALPKRDAVVWADTCAREAAGDEPGELDAKCLDAVAKWLEKPDEDHRRAAMDAADEAGYSTAAAAAAAAAGWTAGSMGPAEYDDVPPPENLAGTMVSTAVLLAASEVEPAETRDTHKPLLEQGLGIAAGGTD